MKRFLVKILGFILPLPVIWITLVYLYGSLVPTEFQKNLRYTSAGGFTSSRFAEADTVRNVDVLVLGNSHAYRGFDPRIFSEHKKRLFNLGTSSQRAVQTRYLVEKYLDGIKPKMVIYEVSYMNLTGDGLESALDICYSTDKSDIGLLEMMLEVNQVKAYNTFLYSLLQDLDGEELKKETRMPGDSYVPGGYVESMKITQNAAELHTPSSRQVIDLEKNGDQLRAKKPWRY